MSQDRIEVARARLGRMALAAVVVCAAVELRAEYYGPVWQVYLFKPITTTLLVAIAAWSPGAPGRLYRPLVVTGLLCSLAGDVFLMLPGDRFVAGLASFLAAHVCYISAFVWLDVAPGLAGFPGAVLVLTKDPWMVKLLKLSYPPIDHCRRVPPLGAPGLTQSRLL